MVFEKTKGIKIKNFSPIEPISNREFWDSKKESVLWYFTENEKLYKGKPREELTASKYREFFVNGNRANFESAYFARRAELANKMFLECLVNDGSYTDDILDLVWMILEETSWVLPAHMGMRVSGNLPVEEEHMLDLFLSETAVLTAFVYRALGEKLNALSEAVLPRIKKRLERDVIDNYLENDYYWMGTQGNVTDNWNPWINSNVLMTALIIEDDGEKLGRVAGKVAKTLDCYLKFIPEDGGCDEGPVYWNQAGLCVLENLWLLNMASDGKINCFGEEKIRNISAFFMKMYLTDGKMVNFADARPVAPMYSASLYKFAEILENDELKAFSRTAYRYEKVNNSGDEFQILPKVLRITDIVNFYGALQNKGETVQKTADTWFEGIEVAVSRSAAENGLIVAAKGGHNDECHNHNDVGNFILYKYGKPFIVDSGNMTYTRETFSDKRYTLWTTRSVYHNLPLINGGEQCPGREYKAKNVSYFGDEKTVTFSLDISEAYGGGERIKKWQRTVRVDRQNDRAEVTEDFEFESEFEYEIHFLVCQSAEYKGNVLTLTSEDGSSIRAEFDTDFECSIENIDCDDAAIVKNWGKSLKLVKLKNKAQKGTVHYVIG